MVVIGGITLATQRGYAVEQRMVAKLSRKSALPVSTTTRATMQAMKDLNIGSMVIATVYKQSINQAVRKYYEDGGLEVLSLKGYQVKLPDYISYK